MANDLITAGLFTTPPAAGKSSEWHVITGGQQMGPISQDALIELAETGKIEADDLVKEVGGEWGQARDVACLRRQFSLGDYKAPPQPGIENLLAIYAKHQAYAPYALFAVVILIGVIIGVCGSLSPSRDLTGTTWQGSENLERFGFLQFDFRSSGTVIMTDATRNTKGTVQGTWSQHGNNVIITFTNCEYRGTIQNNTLNGTANFGQFGPSWNFTVSKR